MVDGASFTFTPCRCASWTTPSTVSSSKSASARTSSSGRSASSSAASRSSDSGRRASETVSTTSISIPPRAARSWRSRSRERLALADEDEPATHAEHPEELERDRPVRGAQRPDRERARHDRGRDQPGGREVVVGPDPEREDDQRDEDEGAEHLAGARAPLARRVEARLEEDEDGDGGEERQPLRRAGLPEDRPVDRVAVEERPQDEGGVDAEREPRDVGEDQRADAQRAAQQADDRPAGEEVDA